MLQMTRREPSISPAQAAWLLVVLPHPAAPRRLPACSTSTLIELCKRQRCGPTSLVCCLIFDACASPIVVPCNAYQSVGCYERVKGEWNYYMNHVLDKLNSDCFTFIPKERFFYLKRFFYSISIAYNNNMPHSVPTKDTFNNLRGICKSCSACSATAVAAGICWLCRSIASHIVCST